MGLQRQMIAFALLGVVFATAPGCAGHGTETSDSGQPGTMDASVMMMDASIDAGTCYSGDAPMTDQEFLNPCVAGNTCQAFPNSTLPGLSADGGLPPLP